MTPTPTRPPAAWTPSILAVLLLAGGLASGPASAIGPTIPPLAHCEALLIPYRTLPQVVSLPGVIGPGGWPSPCAPFAVGNGAVAAANGHAGEVDEDADGVGDEWAAAWQARLGQALAAARDLDGDGLPNLDEFRWELVPGCTPAITNCRDTDQDGWQDGPEVHYWDDAANDNPLLLASKGATYALFDADRTLDSDADTKPNVQDQDSDDDGLQDGVEASLGTYPEFADSECPATESDCLPATQTTYYATKTWQPGKGDGINDSAELAAWSALGASAWTADFDQDGSANNLLDADSDADGLLDGQEFLLGKGQVRHDVLDTDHDGLPDGQEVAWSEDTDLDGLVNANDGDSDGDGMPDLWEAENHFSMVDPTDAALDRDGDGLSNLGEYVHSTDPGDMDTEGDLLLDGEEVNTHHTDPHFWDTDRDGMPDRFEALYGLDPLDAADAGGDVDGDSFDRDQDGAFEKPWPNLDEYRYGRPSGYDEAADGPWLRGTMPDARDTDRDTAPDGYEAYYGTDPTLPVDANTDPDQDGLNWTLEVAYATDPNDPDTDGDGLCDGGRAANCFFPGLAAGFQPGELDYGSTPYDTDSDNDGLPDPVEALEWDSGASGSDADLDGDQYGGLIDPDSDGDALEDGQERNGLGTDLRLRDTDGDGLADGDEVDTYGTDPRLLDMDGDTLGDGAEVTQGSSSPFLADTDGDSLRDDSEVALGTKPASPDSDADGLPDAWEVAKGTHPTVDDAALDLDGDDLTNGEEFALGTSPASQDSDGDGMPDGYEHAHALQPATADGAWDWDADGLLNLEEYQAGTWPERPDSDADGAGDGWETHAAGTDPLSPDTDADGLDDGPEKAAWGTLSATAWSADADGDTLNGVRDLDSDNDGLGDRDEFMATMTRPDRKDTDGDTVSDFDEVVTWGGHFDPNQADTDGDGQTDAQEIAVLDANADDDGDGLRNGDEDAYGTDRGDPDTDCDGIADGPEFAYWGAAPNLLVADVDGDTLPDGVEVGTTGTPPQAFYRTLPDAADTDADGLRDDEEASNGVHVDCASAAGSSSAGSPFGGALDAPALSAADRIDPATRLRFGHDSHGWYLQGGYGVRLHVDGALPPAPSFGDLLGAVGPQASRSSASAPNAQATKPGEPDTDHDGLSDGQEVYTYGTDPTLCDTDHDGLGDGLEVGLPGNTRNASDPCTHRDSDPATRTDPLSVDSDGDGLTDGKPAGARGAVTWEDANSNGRADLGPLVGGYCPASGESSPSDGDTDDDGVADPAELNSAESGPKTKAFCFDTDLDGLSDGLEQGVASPVSGTDTNRFVLGVRTWQPFQGDRDAAGPVTTKVLVADSDADGIVDGLEDFNHNGRFGEWAPEIGAPELDPNDTDVDDDGLSDGLELRIWSPTFPEVVGRPSWSPAELRFEGSGPRFNPYESDPRSADSDGDGTDDGSDVNPRVNALLQVAFEKATNARAFRTLEASDPCCTDGLYSPDVVFYMQLEFLGATTTLETTEITNLYSKGWVPAVPFGLLFNNPATGLARTEPGFGGRNMAPTLQFDIPDNIGEINTSPSAATVTLVIQGRDNDNGRDDMLDFKPGKDSGPDVWADREIREAVNLIEVGGTGITPGASDPWTSPGRYTIWQADDKGNDGDGDVRSALAIHLFDNAPRYFINNALTPKTLNAVPPPNTGTCYGTPTCT
jgi:hypothetical protein